MNNWIPIFKTGTHTDSAGNEKTWTEQELDNIVEKFNPRIGAPVVIGHPKTNAPAWAWVDSLKRIGQILFYREKESQPEFNDMRAKGFFKKRSISLYPDGTLRHIGWLGAQPPAVKGLDDVAFDEGDQTIIEYEEGGTMIEEIKKMFADMMAQIKAMMPEQKKGGSTEMPEQENQQKINDGIATVLKTKEAEFAEAIKKKETEFSEREAALKKRADKLKADEAAGRKKVISDFCEDLKKAGKLIPAMDKLGMGITEFMNQIASIEATVEFGEGADKKKQTPLEFMQSFLSALPKVIEFGEVAGRTKDAGTGSAGDKLSALTKKKLEEKKDYTYTKAFSEVQTENPELAAEYAEELKG